MTLNNAAFGPLVAYFIYFIFLNFQLDRETFKKKENLLLFVSITSQVLAGLTLFDIFPISTIVLAQSLLVSSVVMCSALCLFSLIDDENDLKKISVITKLPLFISIVIFTVIRDRSLLFIAVVPVTTEVLYIVLKWYKTKRFNFLRPISVILISYGLLLPSFWGDLLISTGSIIIVELTFKYFKDIYEY